MKLFHRFAAALLLALASFSAQPAEFRQISQIIDSSGNPVVNGYIYIGTYALDPVTNPISLFSDAALTTPIANPVRTDSYGRPLTDIYFSAAQYSYQLKTSALVSIEGPKNRDAIPTAASVASAQAGTATWGGTAGGTANAITLSLTPAITAYTDGMSIRFRVALDNSAAVTVSVNGIGAKNVVKNDGEALAAGDIQQNDTVTIVFDTTNNRFQLHSPNTGALLTSTTAGRSALLTGQHTIPVLASAMFSRTTNGAAPGLVELVTNDVMLSSKDFDQTTSEGVQFYLPANKGWNESTITVQHGWTAAAGAGTATFATACTAFSDDDAMDTAFSGAQSVTDTLITVNDLHITSVSAAITVAGTPAESDFLICQVTRDVADTLNADAKLIWTKVFWTYSAGNDQ